MKALILAGGSGTRLWPLSRKNYPKQFLKINGERSLLQQTAERLLNLLSLDDIVVMTNKEYRFHVGTDMSSLSTIDPGLFSNFILEPASNLRIPRRQ
jgi:mannose-1-phosphate guanylyltransferase/mannose-6-phosphate isomerase